ncbi:hypothetical protein AKJ09_05157 [Labilithrix luteola]|uniref:Uncharacterized protein n=2 Tax=Labilithrix luteola TaxID=1391654 RepID=A0A0K1PY87_9BACT|nr:hypothetical protein AKJ09_05157 [Labilithrix luteola]
MAADSNHKRLDAPPLVEPRPIDMGIPLNPAIRAVRKQAHRTDDADAFVPDPSEGSHIGPDDAESFAEEFIATATTGEYIDMDAQDEVSDEEDGGPYLELDSEADRDVLDVIEPETGGPESSALSPAVRRLLR